MVGFAGPLIVSCDEDRRPSGSSTDASRKEALLKLKSALNDDIPPADKEFDDASGGYYYGYRLLRAGEKESDPAVSINHLRSSLFYFKKVKSQFPNWKTELIDTRLGDVETKLLSAQEAGKIR